MVYYKQAVRDILQCFGAVESIRLSFGIRGASCRMEAKTVRDARLMQGCMFPQGFSV